MAKTRDRLRDLKARPFSTFDDRYTMRWTRQYDHPVDKVWPELIEPVELDAWLMPTNLSDQSPGGRFAFSFGAPVEEALTGTIAEMVEPKVVVYRFDAGSEMRFQLIPAGSTSRVHLILSFPPGHYEVEGDFPGDLPAGPDTPWRADFVAGFHVCLENLGLLLDGHACHVVPSEGAWWDELRNSIRRTSPR